ncbi:serine hydrolase domain-containing protein [Vulgatibacter incomptus]|uniref:Beta-lactamase class C and other penicillin binding protein n=1 Tax=Vulgatibacter incomptus TaxID=1391653 RepID=A0A0K1PGN8_9BACT|nr:serine hydrolase domain-containing protein [Vulgatibacter incomptus]AKU92672.1 Beta-lactamase class C and other penicillin binding protein [Vulgatibacter incomptus]
MNLRRLSILAAMLLSACATTAPNELVQGGQGGTDEQGGQGGQGGQEAPAFTEAQAAALRQRVESFVTAQGYPNLAIGVVIGGELVWRAGFGEGTKIGKAPDENTFFRAGSVTKLVTSTALLALADEGKLVLDDEAAVWLPEVAAVLSPSGKPAVTLRHLISHASGLPRNGNDSLDWTRPDAKITEADVLAALGGVELLFDPGTRRSYSNIGVALAGLVVSRASGMSYRSFVQERVLDPLGMRDSVWDVPSERLAPGFQPSHFGGYERANGTWRMGAMEPAGGLFTTVGDLARFASHGLGHASVLQADTLAASQTADATGYGLGWIVTQEPKVGTVVWHNGSTSDYGAYLGLLPEHDCAVVILTGTGSLGDVEEIQSLGVSTLALLVDPETDVVPRMSTTPAAAVETVGQRLLLLTSAPTEALVEEAFTWKDGLLPFFESVAKTFGDCWSYKTVEDRGLGSFLLRLGCANGELLVDVLAETSAPYRMGGILVNPAN